MANVVPIQVKAGDLPAVRETLANAAEQIRQVQAENARLRAALEKLRHCAHACGPAPCPHTRKYDEATKGVI